MVPRDPLERFRFYSLWFALLVGVGNALIIAFNDAAPTGWRWGGVVSVAALLAWWAISYQRGRFTLLPAIGEAALLMVVGVAVGPTLHAVGLFLAAYQLHGLYASRRESPWLLVLFGAARLTVYALTGDLTSMLAVQSLGSVLFLSYVGFSTQTVADGMLRQQAGENAIRRSEDRYRILAGATTDAVFDLELATGYVEWVGNVAAFGYNLDEVGNDFTWWMERVHPDDRSRVHTALREAGSRLSGEPLRYRFRKRDGSYANTTGTCVVQRDASVTPIRVVGSVRLASSGSVEAA